MSEIPSVGHVMTAFPHSIDLEQKVSEARELMEVHGVRHLPVTSGRKLVGVITDRDIGLAVGPDPIPEDQDLLVRALAIPDPYQVDFHAPLDHVLIEMADRHIGSALVTHHHRLAGIFTTTDACRLFGALLRSSRPEGNDAA